MAPPSPKPSLYDRHGSNLFGKPAASVLHQPRPSQACKDPKAASALPRLPSTPRAAPDLKPLNVLATAAEYVLNSTPPTSPSYPSVWRPQAHKIDEYPDLERPQLGTLIAKSKPQVTGNSGGSLVAAGVLQSVVDHKSKKLDFSGSQQKIKAPKPSCSLTGNPSLVKAGPISGPSQLPSDIKDRPAARYDQAKPAKSQAQDETARISHFPQSESPQEDGTVMGRQNRNYGQACPATYPNNVRVRRPNNPYKTDFSLKAGAEVDFREKEATKENDSPYARSLIAGDHQYGISNGEAMDTGLSPPITPISAGTLGDRLSLVTSLPISPSKFDTPTIITTAEALQDIIEKAVNSAIRRNEVEEREYKSASNTERKKTTDSSPLKSKYPSEDITMPRKTSATPRKASNLDARSAKLEKWVIQRRHAPSSDDDDDEDEPAFFRKRKRMRQSDSEGSPVENVIKASSEATASQSKKTLAPLRLNKKQRTQTPDARSHSRSESIHLKEPTPKKSYFDCVPTAKKKAPVTQISRDESPERLSLVVNLPIPKSSKIKKTNETTTKRTNEHAPKSANSRKLPAVDPKTGVPNDLPFQRTYNALVNSVAPPKILSSQRTYFSRTMLSYYLGGNPRLTVSSVSLDKQRTSLQRFNCIVCLPKIDTFSPFPPEGPGKVVITCSVFNWIKELPSGFATGASFPLFVERAVSEWEYMGSYHFRNVCEFNAEEVKRFQKGDMIDEMVNRLFPGLRRKEMENKHFDPGMPESGIKALTRKLCPHVLANAREVRKQEKGDVKKLFLEGKLTMDWYFLVPTGYDHDLYRKLCKARWPIIKTEGTWDGLTQPSSSNRR